MDMNKFFYDLDQLLADKKFAEAEEYMKDVKAIFPNSKAAKDGMSVELKFEEV